jgi:histidinol-phosphate phosphatase family protein
MKGDIIFLDKDGTLVEDQPFSVDPSLIRFTPGAILALRRLHARGFLFMVITNQSGIARGLFEETALGPVEARLRELLSLVGVPLAGFYYCPHHPRGKRPGYALSCLCRKPMPGLLFRAAREHHVRLKHAWFIGDTLDDVEAGRRAGCKTILLNNGNETVWRWSELRVPHAMASNLNTAANIILASADREEGLVCA